MPAPTVVALGDSLTQGFQHGAIRRPEWSYPAMIARALGLEIGAHYRHPQFDGPGFPLDVEHMLERLAASLGDSLEWHELFPKLATRVAEHLDGIEDYYERGPGSKPVAFDGHYHNLASWGFNVNEALSLTPAMCAASIARAEGWVRDDLLGLPAMGMHRAALRVFNPSQSPAREHMTMIESLRQLAREEPIDIVLVWLGANDCLDTVLSLDLRPMPDNYVGEDPIERMAFGLTSAQQFARDYARLAEQIAAALDGNPGRRQVYVGSVPHVTIPPITTGVGQQQGHYFERYHRFFDVAGRGKHLTRDDARRIDARVDEFNAVVEHHARAHGWTLVDIATVLDSLSVKRNGCVDQPDAPLRSYLTAGGHPEHPLLQLETVPCVSAYTIAAGPRGHKRIRGGLFGLDHVHPSTLGYGLVAERFLSYIQRNNPDDPTIANARIDWDAVRLADTLEQRPPLLWGDLSAKVEDSAWLWDLVLRAMIRVSR